jgi:hypothetical protein
MEATRIKESSFDPTTYKVQRAEESYQSKDVQYSDRAGVKLSQEHLRLKLDETGTRETTRAATYDEILALLEAEVKGLNEITKRRDVIPNQYETPKSRGDVIADQCEIAKSRDVITDQYENSEVVRETVKDGISNVERSGHKQRMAERMQESSDWVYQQPNPQQRIETNVVFVMKEDGMRRDEADQRRRYLQQNSAGFVMRNADMVDVPNRYVIPSKVTDVDTLTERSGVRHEIRHKRQVSY